MSLNLDTKDVIDGGPPVMISAEWLRDELCRWLPDALERIGDHLGIEPPAVLERARRGDLAASDLPARELLDALGLTDALEEAAKELEP